MRFGKREQIVGLGIFTIVTIGLLHLTVFGPRAEEFIRVQNQLQAAERAGENVAHLERESDLIRFRQTTELVKTGFDDILTSLGLSRPPAFYDPTLQSVQVELSEETRLSKKDREEQIEELRKAGLPALRKQRLEEQVALVFAEIKKLREFTPKEEASSRGENPRFPFLSTKWRVPLEIPEGAQGARLRDNLREAMGTLEILAMVGEVNQDLREAQIRQFNEKIRDIGINNSLYASAGENSLAAQGRYVPLIHKLSIAMMLEEQLEASRDVGGEEIDRDKLYELIELTLPQESMEAEDIDARLGISEFYFLYESLNFVNSLFEMAEAFDVKEITELTLGDPSYLTDLGPPPLPFYDPQTARPAPKHPIVPNPNTFGKEKQTQLALRPAETSLGYCIPVYMQFRATNRVGWTFLYEIMRRFRLAEIDELRISSVANSEGGELNWRVRVLHVPVALATDVDPATWQSEPEDS